MYAKCKKKMIQNKYMRIHNSARNSLTLLRYQGGMGGTMRDLPVCNKPNLDVQKKNYSENQIYNIVFFFVWMKLNYRVWFHKKGGV